MRACADLARFAALREEMERSILRTNPGRFLVMHRHGLIQPVRKASCRRTRASDRMLAIYWLSATISELVLLSGITLKNSSRGSACSCLPLYEQAFLFAATASDPRFCATAFYLGGCKPIRFCAKPSA